MRSKVILALISLTAACGSPLTPATPPLLEAAHSTGGTIFQCDGMRIPTLSPDVPSYSPEINERLRRFYSRGKPAAALRRMLVQQGFVLQGRCSAEPETQWALFKQQGGNGITSFPAFATVYWKENRNGKVYWAMGDIHFTGL